MRKPTDYDPNPFERGDLITLAQNSYLFDIDYGRVYEVEVSFGCSIKIKGKTPAFHHAYFKKVEMFNNQDYIDKMKDILKEPDAETRHVKMDELLMLIIRERIGIDFTDDYSNAGIWYA